MVQLRSMKDSMKAETLEKLGLNNSITSEVYGVKRRLDFSKRKRKLNIYSKSKKAMAEKKEIEGLGGNTIENTIDQSKDINQVPDLSMVYTYLSIYS